jgi:hypothetical protein
MPATVSMPPRPAPPRQPALPPLPHPAARSGVAAMAAARVAGDHAAVQVRLSGPGGGIVLGDARQALADPRLTESERAAIQALVQAVRLLRVRSGLQGIDDAGTAVTLLLRDREATARGPWATNGTVAVGSHNALGTAAGKERARPGMLLPVDVAVHELVHVVQFAIAERIGAPGLHEAIGEGLADAAAMLATDDRTLGEGYFRPGPGGPAGSIREHGPSRTSGPPLNEVERDWRRVRDGQVDAHAAGGVVVATIDVVWRRLGRQRAEQLVWAVIRDERAWLDGGSWSGLADALERAAERLWPGDQAAAEAVQAALRATNLHLARAAGS